MKTSAGVLVLFLFVMYGVLPVHSYTTTDPGADHVAAVGGMGIGVYTCTGRAAVWDRDVCTEMTRCGPEILAHPESLIECHGIVAKCEDWCTLKTRSDGKDTKLSLFIDGNRVWLQQWAAPAILQAVGLANFCIAQK